MGSNCAIYEDSNNISKTQSGKPKQIPSSAASVNEFWDKLGNSKARNNRDLCCVREDIGKFLYAGNVPAINQRVSVCTV